MAGETAGGGQPIGRGNRHKTMTIALGTADGDLAAKPRWVDSWPGSATIFSIAVALAATVTGIATYLVLTGPSLTTANPILITALLWLNAAIVLTLTGLIGWRLVRLHRERQRGLAGAKLHIRLVTLFSLVATGPAVLIAGLAFNSLNEGFDAWFNDRTRTIITNAAAVAQTYMNEHSQILHDDAQLMAKDLSQIPPSYWRNSERLGEIVTAQAALRSLSAAKVIDAEGTATATAQLGNDIVLGNPPAEALDVARAGTIVRATDPEGELVQAVIRVPGLASDYFLILARTVDPRVVEHLRRTHAALAGYESFERDSGTVQLTIGLVYIVAALLVLLAAIWLGLWAANRIVTPIGELVAVATRVGEGDLSARVALPFGQDEMGTLARAFNRMTSEIEGQRDELIQTNDQLDTRRRFIEAVLAGVTAGVIGVDEKGRINHTNRSAVTLLGRDEESLLGQPLEIAVPELSDLIQRAMARPQNRTQGHINLTRDKQQHNLTVRVTSELGGEGVEGYVVTFDDITELVAAQRNSVWAEVARRIAHEIKNPLTPIQLSAERLRRKYAAEVHTDPGVFQQCTDTIIRQVDDIRRMVDEFASFARMPKAVMRQENLVEVVRDAVTLERVAYPEIEFELSVPAGPANAECDGRLVSQAVINLLKNAAEAVGTRLTAGQTSGHASEPGRIVIEVVAGEHTVEITCLDNGCGLPPIDRHQLAEPYITTRGSGTGLGLAIVKKVMEDHGGDLNIEDAPRGLGAKVQLVFPRLQQVRPDGPATGDKDETVEQQKRELAHGA